MCLLLAIGHSTWDFWGTPNNLHTEYYKLSTLCLRLKLTDYSTLFVFETLSRENMEGKVSFLLVYTSEVSSCRDWHIISMKKWILSQNLSHLLVFSVGQKHLPKHSEWLFQSYCHHPLFSMDLDSSTSWQRLVTVLMGSLLMFFSSTWC